MSTIYVVIDDCTVEIEPKRKGMSISSYNINIVGFGEIEISGPREFTQLHDIIQNEINKAMATIDSQGGY